MASQMQNDLHFSSRISHSFLCEFYSNTYRSIALEQIYSTSFEPNSIRASAGSRNPFESAGKKTKDGASAPTVRRLVNLRPNASPNRFAQKTKNVLRLKSYRLVQVALTITQNWGLCIVWNAIELSFILKRKPLPFFKYYSNQPSKQETTCW